MAEREYKRLTYARRRSGFNIGMSWNSSLWLGKDHALCVDTSGYSETYKRFYFRDIQAVIIRRSRRRLIYNAVLGGIAGLFAVSGFLASGSMFEFAVFLWCVAVFFLLLMLINSIKGPGAVCHLRTAVQIEELPSLNRLRRARKILDRIRPLIAAAQGELPSGEIPARMQEMASPGRSETGSQSPQVATESEGASSPPIS